MKGRTAVLTGASGGIGRAIAEMLARSGANLILTGKNEIKLENLKTYCHSLGSEKVEVFAVDLASRPQVTEFIADILKNHAHLDALIYAAGVWIEKNISESSIDEWDQTYEVNVRAPYHLMKELAPLLVKGTNPRIITISSVADARAYPGGTAYCSSKHALRALAECLFYDLREEGVGVTTISPGLVNTSLHANDESVNPYRMIQPSDLAVAVMNIMQFPSTSCITNMTIQPQKSPKVVGR